MANQRSFSRVRRFLSSPQGAIGTAIVAGVLVIAITANITAPQNPSHQNIPERLQGPNAKHFLGTDEFGRDLWSRIARGSRLTLMCAFCALGIGLFFGVPLGVAAGAGGRTLDLGISAVFDTMLAFPGLLLAMAIVAVLGAPNLENTMLAVGIVYIPRFGRLVRAQVLAERQKEYVDAARALCIGRLSLWFRHVLLNCLTPLIVASTLSLATAILEAASLSFLGLGAQPPSPEWGAMLNSGREYIFTDPQLTYIPGVAIMLTVLGINMVGDALHEGLGGRKVKTG